MTPSRLGVLPAAFLALTLASCSGGTAGTSANGRPLKTHSESGGKVGKTVIRVVAAENFWGDVTRQVGGAHVSVTSIISNPNTDPQTYETDPRDAAAISDATFAILNGVGYDTFVSKLLKASPDSSRTVLDVQRISGVSGKNPNPHLWYDPDYVEKTAAAIETALGKADPNDASEFEANEAAFLTAYQPYVAELAKIRAKYSGTMISYTERVPGYLVAAAGLVLGTPVSFSQAVEDGNDPSPGDTAVFDAALTGRKVRVLIYNAQVADAETSHLKVLAARSGIPVVGVTETLPPDEKDFQTWQFVQATKIYEALGG